MARTHTIYVYAENCVQSGMIVPESRHDAYRVGEEDQSLDIDKWGEGTEAELIVEARKDIAEAKGPTYRYRCARNVLKHFGAPLTIDCVRAMQEVLPQLRSAIARAEGGEA